VVARRPSAVTADNRSTNSIASGLHWTASFPSDETVAVSIYVSRKADVAKLDEFVGPKR
jgi:hypothetical protein